ncbi:hypothetical protein PLICRDRAFT_153379 [Plicaturopsis crispa FD-325 SS-3]|nr:hypothetical protein PLICRDRAFT_153379 [Plicaturopsis crispa FD-325 SS-3]
MAEPRQPIHPDIVARLDPEYVAFHNAHLINLPPTHTIAWDPAIRNGPAVPGGSEPLEVASTRDYPVKNCQVRVFTPKGSPPAGGWPVFIFFHGGGWTLGNIGSETAFATNMAVHGKAVVVSVDYRLGPEQPYPAAVEDAVDVLQWVYSEGQSTLGIDTARIAVGGSSSGGNLAAVLTLKAAQASPPIPLVFQLLIVPVTDNTASVSDTRYPSWKENENTPWLAPARMLWFRGNYLTKAEDYKHPDASPMYAPKELLAKTPKAWIAVCEIDILRDEGITYGSKLKEAGVDVEVNVYKGAPHPVMAMDGVLAIGRQLVAEAGKALADAFGNA